MRDLLCLLFSVLGFSGLGFWFRARLFLGAEPTRTQNTERLRVAGRPAFSGVVAVPTSVEEQ